MYSDQRGKDNNQVCYDQTKSTSEKTQIIYDLYSIGTVFKDSSNHQKFLSLTTLATLPRRTWPRTACITSYAVVAMNIRAKSAFTSERTSKGCSLGRENEISHEWTCMEGKVWLSIPMEWKPDSR